MQLEEGSRPVESIVALELHRGTLDQAQTSLGSVQWGSENQEQSNWQLRGGSQPVVPRAALELHRAIYDQV